MLYSRRFLKVAWEADGVGSYWAIAPILLLALGFLTALVYERLLNRRLSAPVGVIPGLLALGSVIVLYATSREAPIRSNLLAWDSAPKVSIALTYYVDTWGASLAMLSVFLGLCTQALFLRPGFGSRSQQNWVQACIFVSTAILLHILFSASLPMLYVGWSAIGLAVYVFLTAIRATEADPLPSDGRAEEVARPNGPNLERGDGLDSDALRMAVRIGAGYALLGSILFIARGGDATSVPMTLRSEAFGLAPSLFAALSLGAYLGLYPFDPWPQLVLNGKTHRSCPGSDGGLAAAGSFLSLLPILAAIYVLGRLYPLMIGGSSPPLAAILLLTGVATIVVGSVRAWRAADLPPLLAHIMSVELGFVAVAFAYGNANALSAGLLLFLNCTIAVQGIWLAAGKFHAESQAAEPHTAEVENGAAGVQPSAGDHRLSPGIRAALLIVPWLPLLGLPFTLGFVAKSMLFAASFTPKYILLWPVGAIADILIIIASLRFLDRMVFADTSLLQNFAKRFARARQALLADIPVRQSVRDDAVADIAFRQEAVWQTARRKRERIFECSAPRGRKVRSAALHTDNAEGADDIQDAAAPAPPAPDAASKPEERRRARKREGRPQPPEAKQESALIAQQLGSLATPVASQLARQGSRSVSQLAAKASSLAVQLAFLASSGLQVGSRLVKRGLQLSSEIVTRGIKAASQLVNVTSQLVRYLKPTIAFATPIVWIASPWIVGVALGFMPNQALYWIVRPAATAILGDYAISFLASETIITATPIFATATAIALAAVVIAFYLYPIPLARRALFGAGQATTPASRVEPARLRFKFLESIIDLIAEAVANLSSLEPVFSRTSSTFHRASILLAEWNDSALARYYFPAITVLGIIILFIFLG